MPCAALHRATLVAFGAQPHQPSVYMQWGLTRYRLLPAPQQSSHPHLAVASGRSDHSALVRTAGGIRRSRDRSYDRRLLFLPQRPAPGFAVVRERSRQSELQSVREQTLKPLNQSARGGSHKSVPASVTLSGRSSGKSTTPRIVAGMTTHFSRHAAVSLAAINDQKLNEIGGLAKAIMVSARNTMTINEPVTASKRERA